MTKKDIWAFIDKEMKLEKRKHPKQLDNLPTQAALVAKETGILIKQCLDKKYQPNSNDKIDNYLIKEASVKVIVSAFRILETTK
jgi:hypothetical protein